MNTDSVMNSPGKDFLNDTEPSGTSRQKDVCIAVLLSNPHNFAALFNYLDLFEDKIRPEELVEMDSRISTLRFSILEEMVKKGQTLYRDILKLWHGRVTVMLGIEGQSQAMPTMPVRSLNYDSANYDRQANAVRDLNINAWTDEDGHLHSPVGLTSGEFMDKFKKQNKIVPIKTAVLFIGEEWDCARNLSEMFEMPDGFMKEVPTWPVKIIDPHTMSDEEIMNMDNNDMKFFMIVVKYVKDKQKMKEMITIRFKGVYISPQIGYITGVITNTKWLEDQFQERRDEWKESENMCLAFEEWEKEARMAGKAEGKAEGRVEGVSEERKRNVLSMHGRGFSAGSIADILVIEEKEVEEIISSLKA